MSKKKKKYTQFRPEVFTRHPSHENLRRRYKNFPLLPTRSVVRLGSTTDKDDTVTNGGNRIEINTIQGVSNSENKVTMKKLFDRYNIPTPRWYEISSAHNLLNERLTINFETINYPVIVKKVMGSRGRGIMKADNSDQLRHLLTDIRPRDYIVEEYLNYPREYRIHVTKDGCIYTCRKMLRQDADNRWYRNQENCIWYLETNPSFNKPNNWNDIVDSCIGALNAVGLDIGACDVRVSRNTDENGDHSYGIIEINSAPRFGDITEEKYMEAIPGLIRDKAGV